MLVSITSLRNWVSDSFSLHSILQALGLPAKDYASHSFRRGGASFAFHSVEGDRGGGNAGVVAAGAAGSVREAREERAEDATGYPRGWESGEIGNEFRNIAQYFAIEKAHRGGNHKGRGWEPGVQGTGSGKFRPPCPPHQSGVLIEFIKILGDWHSDAVLLYLMVPLNVRLQSVNVMANSIISANNTNHTTHSLGLECN